MTITDATYYGGRRELIITSRRYLNAAVRHPEKCEFYLRWRKATQQHMADLRRCDRVPFPAAYC